MTSGPSRQPRADREAAQLDAFGRDVLPGRAGRERVTFGRDPADRLDREQADGPCRAAVVGYVVMVVAGQPEAADEGGLHGPFRDTAGRDADLDDAAQG